MILMNRDDVQLFTLDHFFPTAAVFGGYVMIGGGLLAILTGYLPGGILLAMAGIGIGFTKRRVFIDIKGKRVKPSLRLYFINTGRWEPISSYPFICIQKGQSGYTAYSRGNVRKDFSEYRYLIYILSSDRKKALPVTMKSTLAEARKEMKVLAQSLDLEITLPGRKNPFR
jgi:hypothetical protein